MFHGEWQGWARKLVNHTSSLFFLSLWKREKRFTFLLLLFIYSFIHFFFIYLWIHSFIHFFFFFSLAPSVFYLPQTVKIEKNIQLFFWLNSFAYYLLLDLLFICLFTYLFICLFTCLFFLLKLICCVFFFSLIYFFRYLSIYGFIHLFIISSFLLYLLWIHLFLYTLIHSFIYLFIYLFCIHLFIYFFFFFSLTPSVFYCQFFPHLNNSPYSLDLGTLLVSWFLRLSVLFLSIPKCGVVHAGLILLFWRVWSRAGCQWLASVSKVDLLCMRIPHLSDSGFSGRFLYVFVCRLGILLSCRFFVCFFFLPGCWTVSLFFSLYLASAAPLRSVSLFALSVSASGRLPELEV